MKIFLVRASKMCELTAPFTASEYERKSFSTGQPIRTISVSPSIFGHKAFENMSWERGRNAWLALSPQVCV